MTPFDPAGPRPVYPDPDLADLRVRSRHGYVEFPVHHVRGGTSTGLVIWERHAPQDRALREELLRHLMGLPLSGTRRGNKQITGLGRIVTTGNKVFFADLETDSSGKVRIHNTFAQLAADKSDVDWSVNCGNMTAALAFWALDTGLVPWPAAEADRFEIDIYNSNTRVVTTARLRLKDGVIPSDTEIPGVDGAWPGVDLFLNDPAGSHCGKLLPTGRPVEEIDGIPVSCVDVAMPLVIVRAADLGKTAHEPVEALDADAPFKAKLRTLWVEAGLRMGIKDRSGRPLTAAELAESETVPKICIVGAPEERGHIAARYFTPQQCHRSMAVTGGCCLAAASLVPGSVAQQVVRGIGTAGREFGEFQVDIENPAGLLASAVEARIVDGALEVRRAAYKRSAQVLLRGLVPIHRPSPALSAALGGG